MLSNWGFSISFKDILFSLSRKVFGYLRDGYKTISAAILAFRLRLRQTSQKAFHHSWAMAQTFLLVFLASLENLKFRYEIVL